MRKSLILVLVLLLGVVSAPYAQTLVFRVGQLFITSTTADSFVLSGGIQTEAAVQLMDANGVLQSAAYGTANIPDAALTSNIPKLNGTQTWNGSNTFNGAIGVAGTAVFPGGIYNLWLGPVTYTATAGTNNNIAISTASLLNVDVSAGSVVLTSFQGGTAGRYLVVCGSGANWSYSPGGTAGNSVSIASGTMSSGTCTQFVYVGTQWYPVR